MNTNMRAYHRRITKLDISDKVKLVDSMLESKVPLAKLMEASVRAVTEQILRQLSDINQKLQYHQTKWFAGYRNIYIDEELKGLESITDVLDKKILLLKT